MVEFSSQIVTVFIMTINNKSERNYEASASVGLLLATAVGILQIADKCSVSDVGI